MSFKVAAFLNYLPSHRLSSGVHMQKAVGPTIHDRRARRALLSKLALCFGLQLTYVKISVKRQAIEANIEGTVFVAPGDTDAVPVGLLSFAAFTDVKNFEVLLCCIHHFLLGEPSTGCRAAVHAK